MNKLGLIIVSAAAIFSFVGANAQEKSNSPAGAAASAGQAAIEFKKTTHDFGTFPEEDGRVTCTFTFVNKGTADVVLNKVRASCGCTTPNWTKTPVAPGDTGVVNATYNAAGRPGAFTKTITVTSNAGEHRLTIKGEVIPKAKKIEDEYPFNVGDLRYKNQNVYLHKIKHPESKEEKVKIYNNGSEDITPAFKNVPSYMTVTCSKETIKPKEQAEITIKYDSQKSGEWGSVVTKFDIVNGTQSKTISVNATVVEDFSKLTDEQKKNAPVIGIGNIIPLGDVPANSSKKYKFSVSNNGTDDLIIRRVQCTDESVVLQKPSKAIKSGKKGDITITINTKDMKPGEFTKRLTIISNDPNASQKIISVKGTVK